MRYYVYARRSSEDKAKQIQSIPDQLAWAQEVATQRGLEIIGTFQDMKTGTKPGREGFSQLVEAISNQTEAVGIICWKMDRLARNPVDEGTIKYAFIQGKIKHILAKDREFREGENQILMGVEFSAATQYSIDLGKNVKRGMKSKVEKGWQPGVAPLGYRNDLHGLKGEKRIFPDEERWDRVRKLWDLMLTGVYTIPKIAIVANDELGLNTRKGQRLAHSTLRKMFRNPFYAGQCVWDKMKTAGSHQPMITMEEFERTQIILRKQNRAYIRIHQHTYNALMHCGECGCMITGEPPKIKKQKNGNVHEYHYLRCTKRKQGVKCSQKYISVEELEKQIEAHLGSLEIPSEIEQWIFQQLRKESEEEVRQSGVRRAELQRRYNENEARIDTLVVKLSSGVLDDATFQKAKQGFEDERNRLKKELDRYEDKKDRWIEEVEKVFRFVRDAKTNFRKCSPEEKKMILLVIGSNLTLENRKLLIDSRKPFQLVRDGAEQTRELLASFEPVDSDFHKAKSPFTGALSTVWSG